MQAESRLTSRQLAPMRPIATGEMPRGLDRSIAAGTAAHSGHAKHLANTLKKMALGKTEAYTIKAPDKLRAVAARLDIETQGRSDEQIAMEVICGIDPLFRPVISRPPDKSSLFD